jgi:hypothetical protein
MSVSVTSSATAMVRNAIVRYTSSPSSDAKASRLQENGMTRPLNASLAHTPLRSRTRSDPR